MTLAEITFRRADIDVRMASAGFGKEFTAMLFVMLGMMSGCMGADKADQMVSEMISLIPEIIDPIQKGP